MRLSNYIREVMCIYKIEKFDEKNESWVYINSFVKKNECKKIYNEILKSERGIYRMIKIIEIVEL